MRGLFVVVLLTLACSLQAQDGGVPFGQIGDADVDRLAEFATKSGFDLRPELERVYKKDEKALARLFKFSLVFEALDANARTYGHIVYSAFLNLGEFTDTCLKVLDRQSPDIQQRVRDFLYYPMLRVPKEQREQVEEET